MKPREVLKAAAICGTASVLPSSLAQESPISTHEGIPMTQIPLTSSAGTRKGDMLYRTLGRTGEQVSAIGMGGFHIAQPGRTEDESIRLVRAALHRGLPFMDNSWDYN